MAALPEALLRAEGISCARGPRLLFRGVSLCVGAGDLLELVGDNGSGKTSLLRVLAGLDPPQDGGLYYRGEPLPAARAALARDIAWLGHRPGQCELLSPRENLQWFVALRGSDGMADMAGAVPDVSGALATVGATAFADLPCQRLSAGQQRRVALARLPLARAALWLLDEPFAALDAGGHDLVRALVHAHRAAGGAVIVATHQRLDAAAPALRLPAPRRGVTPGTGEAVADAA